MQTMACVRITLSLLLISTITAQSELGQAFQNLLTNLANNALNVKNMQDYMDQKVKYSTYPEVGASLLKEISSDLSNIFNVSMEVVKDIRTHFENRYSDLNTHPSFFDCCHPPESVLFTYDERLKGKINTDSLCYVGVGSKKSTKHLDYSFIKGMKENFLKQSITKWQYVGSEDGVLYIYPASKTCVSKDYDPRFRPWYVETATPEPRDIVIVLDKSGSMSKVHHQRTLLQTAKNAAKTVVDTLNPNDRVGIVAFSDYSEIPTSLNLPKCYGKELAQGTPKNKENLKKLIDTIYSHGGTNYVAGLTEAFALLTPSIMNKTSNESRETVILFLTDGQPNMDEKDILPTIHKLNAQLANKVVILTFGIGAATDIPILYDMAAQMGGDNSYGEIKAGKHTSVNNPSDLRKDMGSYYQYFSRPSHKMVISVPYFDGFGLGLISSICSPVTPSNVLRGIACIDLVVPDLLGAVDYFRPSEMTYAFIVDNHGRLMTHPLLPKLHQYSQEPSFVDMVAIESAPEAKEIFASILSGGSGNKTFASTRVISGGDSIHDGVDTRIMRSHYFWEQIQPTGYSVCIVIGQDDRRIRYTSYDPVKSFLYHRLDLVKPLDGTCNHFEQLASKDHTAVKFSPYAFRRPSVYLNTPETRQMINEYRDMMLSKMSTAMFKDGVIPSVAITGGVENFWLDPSYIEQTKNYSVWKYIGTQNGVFRIFPAAPLYKQFDHTVRPWYRKSMSNRGLYVVTPPYKDAAGSGIILTLATTVFEGRSLEQSSQKIVFGVMGLDFTISRFYSLIVEKFPECQNVATCFAMDNSGYLVFHRDFVTSEDPKVEHVHIIEKEPTIAADLILKKHMIKHACLDVSRIQDHYFWMVAISSYIKENGLGLEYEVHKVDDSNLFFGKYTRKPTRGTDCSCSSKGTSKYVVCKNTESWSSNCECPCSDEVKFDYCSNMHVAEGDDWPVCTPDAPPVNDTETLGNDVDQLAYCFDYKCNGIISERKCSHVVGCKWCSKKPACQYINVKKCLPGTLTQAELAAAIVSPIALLVIIVVTTVTLCCRKKRRRQKQREREEGRDRNSYRNAAFQSQEPSAPRPYNPYHPDQPPPYTVS